MNAEYESEAERADNPEHYTRDMYRKYVFALNAAKRKNSAQYLSTGMTPGNKFGVVSWHALIPTEKAYETWKKGRQDKSSFPVLEDDLNYKRWKQDFEAEMDHQEISRVVNKDFDPTIMRCSFDIALYKDQKKYL